MKLYKLTDQDGQTRNNTQWGEGVTHHGTGEGELCGEGFIHAYEHPLLAVFFNPIHANFLNPRLWEAEGEIAKRDGQLKCGCVALTTIREIPLPKVTPEQRVRFAILCALEVCSEPGFVKWARGWLDGTDRSEAAARAARAAARAESAWAAELAAARAAARVAARARADINLIAIAEVATGS